MLALNLLINGLVTGCALGVVAVSFQLAYSTTRIFHVAHAGIYTLAGYLGSDLDHSKYDGCGDAVARVGMGARSFGCGCAQS